MAEVREYSPVEESKYYVPEKSAKEEYSTLVVKAGKQGKVEVVAEKVREEAKIRGNPNVEIQETEAIQKNYIGVQTEI